MLVVGFPEAAEGFWQGREALQALVFWKVLWVAAQVAVGGG